MRGKHVCMNVHITVGPLSLSPPSILACSFIIWENALTQDWVGMESYLKQ